LPGRSRILGNVFDGTADIGAAVQRALRTLQHFDALDVDGPHRLAFELLHVVGVEADTLHHFERAYAAHGDGR
jgi:hypothetical protein